MHNEEESLKLLSLKQRLLEEQDMIEWLCTVHRNKVYYPDNPEATKKIQEQLNKASTLISLAYIWAILEEYDFNEHNRWIHPKIKLELKAWKHIRHTGAHAPGSRAKRYYDEFNEFMESQDSSLSGLEKNCQYSENSINLGDMMDYQFFRFIQNLVDTVLGYCANHDSPEDVQSLNT